MKKLLATILLSGLVACSPTKKNQLAPTDVSATCNGNSCPINSIQDVIQEDNWQFTLTGDGWVSQEAPDSNVKVVFTNPLHESMVFLIKEAIHPLETFPDYTMGVLRALHHADMVIDSSQQVKINGKVFILVTSHGMKNIVWTWVNVTQSTGYIFSCKTLDDEDDAGATPFERCMDIANTLVIK